MKPPFEIIDAHTHLFSYAWLDHFRNLSQGRFASVEQLAEALGWDVPSRDPADLGRRWVEEQDKYGVARQVLFASKLNDAESVAAAVNAFPARLIGYVMIDPTAEDARAQTQYALNILGMKGILMFPALHHFRAHEEAAYTIYEEAHAAEVPVFLHFGQLSIPIFQKIGIPDNIDLSYSNPLDLQQPARDFRDLNFIIPHFGCGRLEEALAVAGDAPNVYFDTSSSNTWIQPPLTLSEVFRRTLDAVGPERILFGSDSSWFPRGWRRDIFETQKSVLDEINIVGRDQALIFAGNIKRLLRLK